MRYFVCVLASALLLGIVAAPALGQTTFEDFTTDPGWTVIGSGSNGNNFGYRTSSFAGGASGEGGGLFTFSSFLTAYGDPTIGTFTLNDALTASGRFDYTTVNGNPVPDFVQPRRLGHFNPAVNNANRIGLALNNSGPDPNSIAWAIRIDFADGTNVQSAYTDLAPNNDRTFSYSWDPNGGVFGAGRLTGTVVGQGGGVQTLDLTVAERARGASFNFFGFNSTIPTPPGDDPLVNINMFIDDVTYSAVPEPLTLLLTSVGLAGGTCCEWYRRRGLLLRRPGRSAKAL